MNAVDGHLESSIALVFPGDEFLRKRVDFRKLLLFSLDQQVVDPVAGLQCGLEVPVALDQLRSVFLNGRRLPVGAVMATVVLTGG